MSSSKIRSIETKMASLSKLLLSLCLIIAAAAISTSSLVSADSIQGCGGFVEASSSLIKSRKSSDAKLDYSHITVELRTVDGLVKDSTQCAPNGYYFIPVYDKGSFIITIKGPEGWSWNPDKVPVVINNNGCNANADINFQFTGFTASGRVVGAVGGESCSSKDGGPSDVKVELLSTTDDIIYSALTASLGTYVFTNIIPGKYKLRASHMNLKVESRGSLEVDVGFGNIIVDDIFFVPGYDIQGSVVAQGNPILGVHLYLYSDDITEMDCPQDSGNAPRPKALCHAISDADGKFTFSNVPCGSYELLPYYKGENKIFDVSPPSMLVSVKHHHVIVPQTFQVTGFSVGGRVVDERGVGVDGVKIIVDGHERFITDKQGYFKLDQVTSKRYTVVAEKDHYKFKSLENFMAEVNIYGTVLCKEKCGPAISVSLMRSSSNNKEERKTVGLTDESSDFMFPKVFPGKYRLVVKRKSSLASSNADNWCWERSSIDIDVGTEDMTGIVFVQKGYWIHITSTHDADAFIQQPDASVLNLQIKKGSQRICVESPGAHELHFIKSCIFFGSSIVKFNTTNPLPIHLKADKYLLEGKIHVEASLHANVNELSESIIVDAITSDGEVIDASPARLVPHANDITTSIVFNYSIWANLGDELTLVPRDLRNGEVKKFLFYPKAHHISVIADGCQSTIPLFSGRLGLYIEGSVSPPISGVNVRILALGDSDTAPLQKGEVVVETTTGPEGFFFGGPLYDDANYTVEASKPGYHLKPIGSTSFSCQKLSQISVRLYSGEESSEQFPSVLLSLSGEDGYRNNSVTAVGGFFLFHSLFPGTFYLRPLLKEYSFSPAAQAIELGSGEYKEVVFQATRVAYRYVSFSVLFMFALNSLRSIKIFVVF
ncbi:hypothetical protein AQUCO_02900110v1 [Aquilegia coerulea]|uniref:Carbohydrate-binding-like fold protein n=1 Tax=Aquilegia coerulea TaxID=218851 RepID=A0A2G5D3F1_AQUCA|nr:hypothetical protein AQUCO_02900110v1 [Aquilegia coerulea]